MRTEMEVMLTMRPKRRSTMPSMVASISSIGVTMFQVTPFSRSSRASSRKSLNGGPPALVTRMSGSGRAASSALAVLVVTSAATAVTLAPVSSRIARAVAVAASPSRPLITTSTPARASAVAQARPNPRLDAHTIARRPLIPRSSIASPRSLLRSACGRSWQRFDNAQLRVIRQDRGAHPPASRLEAYVTAARIGKLSRLYGIRRGHEGAVQDGAGERADLAGERPVVGQERRMLRIGERLFQRGAALERAAQLDALGGGSSSIATMCAALSSSRAGGAPRASPC